MNISPINSNLPTSGNRPVAAQAPASELQQMFTNQASNATQVQTEQAVTQTQKAEANRQELEDAVKQVNNFLKPINSSIEFNLDDDTGRTIVRIVELESKDVIRQIPSEEMLSIAKAIDKIKGLLIHQKA